MPLMALFRAIASGESEQAAKMLARSPALAREALRLGASRETATPYFFERIGHYVYAGDTALHVAAAAYDVALVTALVASGADVTAANRRGATPLHYAADGSPNSAAWNPAAQAATVRILIEAGADPNAKDKSGVAPIHRAVRTRCLAAVRSLLENGADPSGTNKSGSTPLDLAVRTTGRSGSGSVEARALQREIVELLHAHGASAT